MFHLFEKEAGQLQIEYRTEDLKMGLTHNVRWLLRFIGWCSEAQPLDPKISNNEEAGCLLSDSRKKKIIWKYTFELFEDEVHYMNKNGYIGFHTYTEVKSDWIISEEWKASNPNKISETDKPKDNSSWERNSGNNKNKGSNQKKKYQQNNTNPSVNKNSSMKCTYFGQYGHFAIKCFKNPQGESYKGKVENPTGGIKVNLMT